jgi:hypothetical protein
MLETTLRFIPAKKPYNGLITMSDHISPLNSLLSEQLIVAHDLDQKIIAANNTGEMIEMPTTGKILSSAYEQLRNAAEYAEEHLLLQRAIKRFCNRNLFITKKSTDGLGQELIVELVLAGYLEGTEFSKSTATKIDTMFDDYMNLFSALRQARVQREVAIDWILALMSSEAENLLNPHHAKQALVFFAYHHFLQTIPKDHFNDLAANDRYEFCMYIAVHQALLKSDIDSVRYDLNTLYKQSPKDSAGFKNLNKQIDDLFGDELTHQLKRIIGRHGAPFRVLKSMINERNDMNEMLTDKKQFLDAYNWQINLEYRQLHQRLNRLFTKSIIFLFITKVLIGLAVEVPYDLIVNGSVALIPLGINLSFPPIYIAGLRINLRLPTKSNATTIQNYMERLLYDDSFPEAHIPKQRTSSPVGKVIYSICFFIPFAITIFVLQRIGFNIVQMIIFFVFFSTASFLGFRLSALIRELELTTRQTGFLASLRDFFYLPFIVAGQWLSRKYNKINAVARFLDIAIELPLKTVLRLLRQWIRFLNEQHEELY